MWIGEKINITYIIPSKRRKSPTMSIFKCRIFRLFIVQCLLNIDKINKARSFILLGCYATHLFTDVWEQPIGATFKGERSAWTTWPLIGFMYFMLQPTCSPCWPLSRICEAPISFVMSTCPVVHLFVCLPDHLSACIPAPPTGRISTKFDMADFYGNL